MQVGGYAADAYCETVGSITFYLERVPYIEQMERQVAGSLYVRWDALPVPLNLTAARNQMRRALSRQLDAVRPSA